MSEVIEFECAVAGVSDTRVDGGKTVKLALPEDTSLIAAKLMEAKRLGVYLKVTMVPSEDN